ncbi:hypothetical protein D9615_007313 [Tricholomella constricta]|uniref:Uncharacterized protein n=1 Tax=Tricholomella constricta TaxID=117010 RepID=A0A8H5M103_9AGAR|nr:hypothetical protein D9615_007313 [Tricholomella constricta]
MALSYVDSASSDEEDAPESVSLAQSMKNVKKQDDVLKQIHTAEKEKKKLRNKERDRRLKEQAESSKKRRKKDEGDADLEARMERAMQEAEAESSEDSEFEDEEEFMGIDVGSRESSEEENFGEEEDDDEDDEMDTDEENSEPPAKLKANPNHLPDHLFASAFSSSSKSTKVASKRKATEDTPARKRKRVRSNAPPKDLLIGSRAMRTLASGLSPAGAATLPSAKVRKFLNRSLALKGGHVKKGRWERRPVNLGVMRRDGPAASFVRKR